METKNLFQGISNWLKTSVGLKLVIIGSLVLVILIPIEMVEGLVNERSSRQRNVEQEIGANWSKRQHLIGPLVTVPYYEYTTVKNEEGKAETYKHKRYAHFLPKTLNSSGVLHPITKHRGIYNVVVYSSTVSLVGSFEKPDFSKLNVDVNDVLWQEAEVVLGLSDLRGIGKEIKMGFGSQAIGFKSGAMTKVAGSTAVSAKVDLSRFSDQIPFATTLNIKGSKSLYVEPIGALTKATLSSSWPNPSFRGAFLPSEAQKKVSEKGFEASWEVLHLNRNYPQQFFDGDYLPTSASFGVELFVPVDHYSMTSRAVKYAVLFVALTFLFFFFSQFKEGFKVHVIHYLLVGLALTMFFTLLIALTEHLAFSCSYFISSLVILVMVSGYMQGVFKNSLFTKKLAAMMSVMFVFIFVIIQLQDYALLMGAIGLLLILGTIMYSSRKIRWTAIAQE